jgi:hypothetical protein
MSVGPHLRAARRRLAFGMAGVSLATVVSCTSPTTPTPTTTTTTTPGSVPARGNPASYRTYQAAGGIPRWNPCAPIRYVTNLSGAGYPGALADVEFAVDEVSRASGLTFRYDGEVGTHVSRQYGNYQVGGAFPPVLIAWARRSETDAYADISTPGATLAATHIWFRTGTATGSPVIVGGNVAVEPDALASSRVVPGSGVRSVGVVVMHELGHLVGLDHVSDTLMIMAPAISQYRTWGAGDQTGLRVVGAGHGCLPAPASPSTGELSTESVPEDDLHVIARG